MKMLTFWGGPLVDELNENISHFSVHVHKLFKGQSIIVNIKLSVQNMLILYTFNILAYFIFMANYPFEKY